MHGSLKTWLNPKVQIRASRHCQFPFHWFSFSLWRLYSQIPPYSLWSQIWTRAASGIHLTVEQSHRKGPLIPHWVAQKCLAGSYGTAPRHFTHLGIRVINKYPFTQVQVTYTHLKPIMLLAKEGDFCREKSEEKRTYSGRDKKHKCPQELVI